MTDPRTTAREGIIESVMEKVEQIAFLESRVPLASALSRPLLDSDRRDARAELKATLRAVFREMTGDDSP